MLCPEPRCSMPGQWNRYTWTSRNLPEGIESVHPRYAITWRNRWMLDRADFVVTYITHSWGGAAKFAQAAEKKEKTVINLGEKKETMFLNSLFAAQLL